MIYDFMEKMNYITSDILNMCIYIDIISFMIN